MPKKLWPKNRVPQPTLDYIKLPFPLLSRRCLLRSYLVEARRQSRHTLLGAGRQVELETAIDIDRDRIAGAILEAVAAEV